MSHNITIRPAATSDLEQINAIYNYYVQHTTCVWTTELCTADQRFAWYEDRTDSMPILVAENSNQILGFGALSSFRAAYTHAGTLEDAIYVHHDHHRKGIGSRLLNEILDFASQNGIRSLLANISADQTPSIKLHEKFGFKKVAHFHQVGLKFNQRIDAVFYQLVLVND